MMRIFCRALLPATVLLSAMSATVAPVQAGVIFSATQTGVDLLSNPDVIIHQLNTTAGTSLQFTNSPLAFNMQFEWQLVAAGSRGATKVTIALDYTVLNDDSGGTDNDYQFGLHDGTNAPQWQRSDAGNAGGTLNSFDTTVLAPDQTSFSNLITKATGLGTHVAANTITLVFDLPGNSGATVGTYTEESVLPGGVTRTFVDSGLNEDAALSFFMIGGKTENYQVDQISVTVETVPEPAALWLTGVGLIGLAPLRRRKRRKG